MPLLSIAFASGAEGDEEPVERGTEELLVDAAVAFLDDDADAAPVLKGTFVVLLADGEASVAFAKPAAVVLLANCGKLPFEVVEMVACAVDSSDTTRVMLLPRETSVAVASSFTVVGIDK